MKNRASSHLLIIFIIIGLEVVGYLGVHRAAALRGYETSVIGGVRDLLMFLPLIILVLWALAQQALHRKLGVVYNCDTSLLFWNAGPISLVQ
jgi:hypothetical protein